MAISYTSHDCLITLSTDREDWEDFVDTKDPDTGESPPQSREHTLALKAIDMGLGTSTESVNDLAQKAQEAGVEAVRRDGRRWVALTKEEALEETVPSDRV